MPKAAKVVDFVFAALKGYCHCRTISHVPEVSKTIVSQRQCIQLICIIGRAIHSISRVVWLGWWLALDPRHVPLLD